MPPIKQVERVIKILQRLALHREVTVAQLYEYFEHQVPKRTLQRDLIEISASDIPVVTRQGQGKALVWTLEPNFVRFVPETIGSQELLASYFLERLATITKGTKLERDINSLFKKARQLVSPEVFQTLEQLDQSQSLFGATFTGYIDYSPHSDVIDQLLKAATERRTCRFTYKANWKKEASAFAAEPYMLVYHKGALYAVVFVPAHDHFIFLAVQRIRNIETLPHRFKRKSGFDLQTIRKGRFGIYGNEGLKPRRIVLKFYPDVAEAVAERIWHASQKTTRYTDGSLKLELTAVVSDELRGWVASWRDYVSVVQPIDLLTHRDN